MLNMLYIKLNLTVSIGRATNSKTRHGKYGKVRITSYQGFSDAITTTAWIPLFDNRPARRLKHPAVVAIHESVRTKLFDLYRLVSCAESKFNNMQIITLALLLHFVFLYIVEPERTTDCTNQVTANKIAA